MAVRVVSGMTLEFLPKTGFHCLCHQRPPEYCACGNLRCQTGLRLPPTVLRARTWREFDAGRPKHKCYLWILLSKKLWP